MAKEIRGVGGGKRAAFANNNGTRCVGEKIQVRWGL